MISIIVAKSQNNIIGNEGKIPWHLPDDLRYFKKITMGATLIMGRKTYHSIGKPLPGRKNIILTQNPETVDLKAEEWKAGTSAECCSNKDTLIHKTLESKEETFVIGGAEIYRLFMPFAKTLYITEIHQTYEGSVAFPNYDKHRFREISRVCHHSPLNFDFVIYRRVDKDNQG